MLHVIAIALQCYLTAGPSDPDYYDRTATHLAALGPVIVNLMRISATYFPVHVTLDTGDYYILDASVKNRGGYLQVQLRWGDETTD